MKKLLIIFTGITIFFASCTPENEVVVREQGSLAGEPKFLETRSKQLLQGLVAAIAPQLLNEIEFEYDLNLYKIEYYTLDANDEITKASGLLILPVNAAKALPILSYQHGTVLNKLNVPSQLKGGYEVGMIPATSGYIVICPDYVGLGSSPGLHPYVHARTEAWAVIDMIKAIKSYCSQKSILLNKQLFLLGYSQGGHATMAAAKYIEKEFANELPLTASACMAGPYDLSGTQYNYLMRDSVYPSPGYLPYLIFSYNPVYKMFPSLSDVFLPDYYNAFAKIFTPSPNVELNEVDKLWPENASPSAAFKPEIKSYLKEDEENSLKKALAHNDLYNWAPKAPMLLCHCDGDMHVPYANSEIAYQNFLNNGSKNVQFINPLAGGTHTSCALPAFVAAIEWFYNFKE